jgi:hypothetical protein
MQDSGFQPTAGIENRTLTDADIDAITKALETRMVEGFYKDLGKGVWGLAKRAFWLLIAGLAAYGYMRGTR